MVFLCPELFAKGREPTAWVPLVNKGALVNLPSWLYHKDEWTKKHPIFEGLPAGDLMDYTFYREIIPDAAWVGQDAPAEVVAGAINTSIGYSAGLLTSVHPLGAGRFVLNTLHIRVADQIDPNGNGKRLSWNEFQYIRRESTIWLPATTSDVCFPFGRWGNVRGYAFPQYGGRRRFPWE
ncbi:MAG: hypothetical protein ACC645_03095 [Pirellulales bacterium]